MEVFQLLLAIVLLASRCAGDDNQVITAGDYQWTCPDPDVIFPCVCNFGDLDCSKVDSEDQLAQIMGSSFPNPNFRTLIIKGNDNLRVLRAGHLGNTTYKWFDITHNALEEVEADALSGSYSTVSGITMSNNRITSFPWEELSSMTLLTDLFLYKNNISEFSSLTSDTLRRVSLSHNPLGRLEATVFSASPSLVSISLVNTGQTYIMPGTFVGLANLSTVALGENHLVHLAEGTIEIPSSAFGFVELSRNNLSSVAVNAIYGFPQGGDIVLWDNHLTVLEEEVWRPLLQIPVYLLLDDNPLLCGCDIAWLLRNTTLLGGIETSTKCSSGELLVNLDPDIFEHC